MLPEGRPVVAGNADVGAKLSPLSKISTGLRPSGYALRGRCDMSNARHSWADKTSFAHKSERECKNGCGIVKVTRHEDRAHWVEFWRGLEKIQCDRTPKCEQEQP